MKGITKKRERLLGDNVLQAFDVIRARRMRSALLILGVAIGITTILTIVTVMNGLVKKVHSDLQSSSRPYLFVTRFDFFGGGNEEELLRRKKFDAADADAIGELCPSVDDVCYFISQNEIAYVLYREDKHTPPVELDGSGTTFSKLFSVPIEHGRNFTEIEVRQSKRVAVLGHGPAKALFPHEHPIGKHIDIEDKRYEVIGTFTDREHFIGSISNNFVIIPYTAYWKDFQTDKDDPTIAANAKEGSTIEEALEEVTNVLRTRRNLRPGDENDFHIATSTAFLEVVGKVTFAISAVLFVIASIGLVVGGIGVMNIMLISVTERTREIGVRMALGASKRDIVQQFLTESATLTGLGGVIGTVFGVVFAFIISSLINFPFYFSIPWTITAILFSALIGIIFGIYPARRAANLNPVDALRYE